eukprot:3528329-Rhodomonas_salina.3
MWLDKGGAGTVAAVWLTGRGRTAVGRGIGSACPVGPLVAQVLEDARRRSEEDHILNEGGVLAVVLEQSRPPGRACPSWHDQCHSASRLLDVLNDFAEQAVWLVAPVVLAAPVAGERVCPLGACPVELGVEPSSTDHHVVWLGEAVNGVRGGLSSKVSCTRE